MPMPSRLMSSRWMLGVALGGCALAGLLVGRTDTRAAESAAAASKAAVIGVVDLFSVLNESRMYKDLKEELKKAADEKKAEAGKREDRAKQAQETVEAFKRTAPEFRDKFKAFVDAAVDYNAYVRLSQADQVLMLNRGTWRVYQAILETIKAVAKDRGVDLVLYLDDFEPNIEDTQRLLGQIRQRKVLHASPEINLTQAVLERFDADYQKGRITSQASPPQGTK
jgi:Skp family chaperone for outer membrane proteins